MERDRILITGGNSGIGFQCARELARRGKHVIIASRNRQMSRTAVQEIIGESGSDSASEMGLDLGSIAGIREFAQSILDQDIPLSALVCNAGLQFNAKPQYSADGFELTFAVNHLGHFLLANMLLDHLKKHAPARIVVVASGVHDPAQKTGMPLPDIKDFETLAKTGMPPGKPFHGRLAYVNSKLCNMWFTYEMMRRMEQAGLTEGEQPVSINAYEPGLVPGSGLARDYPAPLRAIWHSVLPVMAHTISPFKPTINPASKSGKALAAVVLDPGLERVSGKYFPSHTRWRESASSEESYDEERARELWEHSLRLTKLQASESPLVT